MMCVDARYLIQYIHFSFHRFCDEVAEALLLSSTIVQPHIALCVAGSGSGVKLLPPIMAATQGMLNQLSLKLH